MALCIARAGDGNVYCVDDTCSHEQASLSEGYVLDLEVECPMHGSLFDLRTGAVHGAPASEPIRAFPVTLVDGDIFVDVEPTSS